MVKIYKSRVYAFISSIGSLLYILSFFLQSCSIRRRELNINPIPIEYLENDLRFYVNGCFPKELRSKFTRLEEEGFVNGQDLNNDDIRKHFMFVFCNSLNLKEPGTVFDEHVRDQFVRDFRRIPGNQMLIWEPVRVDWDTRVARNNRLPYTVEFRIRDLFTNFYGFRSHDDSGNLDIFNWDFSEHGRSPRYLGDRVDVDHLFRDNSITIELPAFLHREKNRLIDNLIRLPRENVIRESDNYWTHRPNRGRL